MQLADLTGTHLDSYQQAHRRLNVWTGAVSSGKTITSLTRWVRFVRLGPAGSLLMIGKTERTLKRNVLDPLRDMYGPAVKGSGAGGEITLFGRTVYLVGANDQRSEGKIRGLSLVGAYGDEVTLWPDSFFRMLLSRLREHGARFYGTTNPDHPRHWFKVDFLDRGDELDLATWHLTIDDNPTLDPAYVSAIKTEYTGLWYQRFIEGRWVAAEGAIWPALSTDQARIVQPPPDGIRFRRWTVAVDYGTTNPLHALLAAIGDDGRLWVLDEWRWDSRKQQRQLTDADYSTRLRGWLADTWPDVRPERIVYDPSAASFGAQLRADGWPGVTAGDNDVSDGIRLVDKLLAPAVDRLRIHPRCVDLLAEAEAYRWDEKASREGRDAPVKQDDHGPDSLRYLAMAMRMRTAKDRAGHWA